MTPLEIVPAMETGIPSRQKGRIVHIQPVWRWAHCDNMDGGVTAGVVTWHHVEQG
jgi:hypothetical protein